MIATLLLIEQKPTKQVKDKKLDKILATSAVDTRKIVSTKRYGKQNLNSVRRRFLVEMTSFNA